MSNWLEEVIQWWEDYNPHGGDPELLTTGLRKRILVTCQYWQKGLPNLCSKWELDDTDGSCGGRCNAGDSENVVLPSGYNNSKCDFIGRQYSCSSYDPIEQADEWVCIAPCKDRSGVVVKDPVTEEWGPVSCADVYGYNHGMCDGAGTGLGPQLEDGSKLTAVVCNHYRPWQMGFGAASPDSRFEYRDGVIDREASIELKDEDFATQLPYSFSVFNCRAKFQKCLYWDADYGSDFVTEAAGGIALDFMSEGGKTSRDFCTCQDVSAAPYCTPADSEDGVESFIMGNVWAKSNSVICNGAKDECPMYTGKWLYNTDEKMANGHRITAEQLMELRFWRKAWISQKEFDDYFNAPPNKSDDNTAELFTFKKWVLSEFNDDFTIEDPYVMVGNKVKMKCLPAPPWYRRFDTDVYINNKEIVYPRYGDQEGTPEVGNHRFPSLVRNLDIEYARYIEITYPKPEYDSAMGKDPCVYSAEQGLCIKKSNAVKGDYISVVGATVRNKRVIVINTSFVEPLSEFSEYSDVFMMSNKIRSKFQTKVRGYIDNLIKNDVSNIYIGTADSLGYFAVPSVKLKYHEINNIIVLVDFGDMIDYRIKEVWSQWYGGEVYQTKFSNIYHADKVGGYGLPKDTIFTGDTSAEFSLLPMSGNNPYGCETVSHELLPVYSKKIDGVYAFELHYGYCIKETKHLEQLMELWGSVGNTNKVWVEIDDINLNYIYKWSISKAAMTEITESGNPKIIEMGILMRGGVEDQSISPNACVLAPLNGEMFVFNPLDWELTIDYSYAWLSLDREVPEDGDDVVVFPGFSEDQKEPGGVKWVDPKYSVEGSGNHYVVDKVTSQTVALMGHFADETGRLISTMATKAMCSFVDIQCRNVEIKFGFSAKGEEYTLVPESGISVDIKADRKTGAVVTHSSVPPCGDHKFSFVNGLGPVWFPYDSCETMNRYNLYIGSNWCTDMIKGPGEEGTDWYRSEHGGYIHRPDFRHQGPDIYKASTSPRGNWLRDCNPGWKFYYSKAGETKFSGYVNIVSKVNDLEYAIMGWQMPPFGNRGREIVDRWLTEEQIHHIDMSGDRPIDAHRWVPYIITDDTMYQSFNAFDSNSIYGIDPFKHTCQLNLLKSNAIEEELELTHTEIDEETGEEQEVESRFRWEEIFHMDKTANASYPPPIYLENKVSFVSGWLFKQNDISWAWRVPWKDIQRSVEDKLTMLLLDYPEYRLGLYKDEHRYVLDEGEHIIKYTAPEIEDGMLIKYPSVAIDGGTPRYFDIMYDIDTTYAPVGGSHGDMCEWMDEGDGTVDSSAENIYNITKCGNSIGEEKVDGKVVHNVEWEHDENILFDGSEVSTYVEAAEQERSRLTEFDWTADYDFQKHYGIYNRGLIAKIPQYRLKYLPYETEDLGEQLFECDDEQSTPNYGSKKNFWYNTSPILIIPELSEQGLCITEIKIDMETGTTSDANEQDVHMCKPGVQITATLLGGEQLVLCDTEAEYGEYDVTDITFVNTIDVTPFNMISKRIVSLSVKLICYPDTYISMSAIEIKAAEYVDKTETINTYERKYVVSRMENPSDINLDGTSNVLLGKPNRQNSGIYVNDSAYLGETSIADKIRSIHAHEYIDEDEKVSATMGNLRGIEKTLQRDIYRSAYDVEPNEFSNQSFMYVTRPILWDFVDNGSIRRVYGGLSEIRTDKLKWENIMLVQQFRDYDFWSPGGHKFQWNMSNVHKSRCFIFGGLKEWYEAELVHYLHGGSELAVDPGYALYQGRLNYQYAQLVFWDTASSDYAFNMSTGEVPPPVHLPKSPV